MRLPWSQLSASPCTVLFRWKSVVDHIDQPRQEHHGGGRRRGLGRGDAEPGKTRQWKPARRGVRGFTGSAAV